MSAVEPQVVELEEFTDWSDYPFSGNELTVQRKRAFIVALRFKSSIYRAAMQARISRKSVYNWLDTDPVFVVACEHAREDCADNMETSVYNRAFKSDLLAMFWLKAHRSKFKDRQAIDVNVVQQQVEDKLSSLRARLGAASTKDIITTALAAAPTEPVLEAINKDRGNDG